MQLATASLSATAGGNFFEDFFVGQHFHHATPRTISCADGSLHIAFTGARQPLNCSTPLAQAFGFRTQPVDDMLLFNIAFGKTVADISANAVANLGYADVRFLAPVFAGDTIGAQSDVIGLKPTSDGLNGVVYVRSTACNQHAEPVLSWIRWVLIRRRAPAEPAADTVVPDLPGHVEPGHLIAPMPKINLDALRLATGSPRLWSDYSIGERIDHPAGMTLDESDHTLATKLYQNTARVHFDALMMRGTPHGRRLVYGGHVISVCRALSYDGLENVVGIGAINGGVHAAPTFAGDTIYCFTEVVDKFELQTRDDCGAVRLRLVGLKNNPPQGFTETVVENGKMTRHADVVLALDYTVFMPRG